MCRIRSAKFGHGWISGRGRPDDALRYSWYFGSYTKSHCRVPIVPRLRLCCSWFSTTLECPPVLVHSRSWQGLVQFEVLQKPFETVRRPLAIIRLWCGSQLLFHDLDQNLIEESSCQQGRNEIAWLYFVNLKPTTRYVLTRSSSRLDRRRWE